MSSGTEYERRYWIDDSDLLALEYARYWNDESAEREKEWWVVDGDFRPMERHLSESGLLEELADVLDLAQAIRGRGLTGEAVDVAAGSLWAVPHLLEAGATRVYAVEYSRHRLEKLGPIVLDHYGVAPGSAVLCLGSFYDLQFPDGSLDAVFASQAVHHAERPQDLLAEIARVLAPGGVVLVIGEPLLDPHRLRRALRHGVKAAASRVLPRRLQQRFLHRVLERVPWRAPDELPADPVLGDHFHSTAGYARMFAAAGFRSRRRAYPSRGHQAFVLTRA